MNINEILGEYNTRYFGAGHKNTGYLIKDIREKEDHSYEANATVNISKKNWSIKDGKIMKAHLSTIDALVLSCLMVEKALSDVDVNKFYVHKFTIKAGSSAIENLDKIPITLKAITINDKQINCQVDVNKMNVKLLLKLRSNLPSGQSNGDNYISNHFKDSVVEIDDIHYINQSALSTKVTKKVERDRSYQGLGSCDQNRISIVEWLVVFSQLGEVMAYHFDDLKRSESENLWMKRVKATFNEGTKEDQPIINISEIINTSLVNMKGNKWRVINAKGSDINNSFYIEAKIAHQLPTEDK